MNKRDSEIEIFGFLKRSDIFSKTLPSFNLNGQKRVGSIFGGLLTLMIFYITFLFALERLIALI